MSKRVNFSSEERKMDYFIAITLVSMVALYAFIILGCSKHIEW